MIQLAKRFFDALNRMRRSRDGNVTILFALSSVPLLLTLGAGVDYGLAMKRQGRMNAAADAAALMAVTPSMMSQTATVAQASAMAFFNSQVAGLTGANYNPSNLTITVTDSTGTTSIQRTVTVAYKATSSNTFSTLLQIPTLGIKGTSTATAAVSPNIDFYLMLDTSPSMAIAANQSGIDFMVSKTSKQGGCAFACHQSDASSTAALGNEDGLDNYGLARKYGVTLRIDLVQQAVANLISQAKQTALTTTAKYRMALYTFDFYVNNPTPLTAISSLDPAQANNAQMLTVYNNNGFLTKTLKNNDSDTDFGSAFSALNTVMPTPGNGTNVAGDTPQEVLFIVTDGVSDYSVGPNYASRTFTPLGPSTDSSWNNSWCTAIKKKGIRIAMLYTTYNPLPTNSFYNSNIKPFQPQIATAAKNCASDNLYFQVNTGGDISAAMLALFQAAVSAAHLTN